MIGEKLLTAIFYNPHLPSFIFFATANSVRGRTEKTSTSLRLIANLLISYVNLNVRAMSYLMNYQWLCSMHNSASERHDNIAQNEKTNVTGVPTVHLAGLQIRSSSRTSMEYEWATHTIGTWKLGTAEKFGLRTTNSLQERTWVRDNHWPIPITITKYWIIRTHYVYQFFNTLIVGG